MSVTVTHPEYDARIVEWERIQAVLAGRDAVIAKGEEFVPILGGQSAEQYRAYLLRGNFFNGTYRAREGIVGLVFSQEPQHNIPESIEKFLDDITLNDTSLTEFAKEVFSETVAFNWGGILVDVPEPEDITDPAENRPYMTFYHAFNVRWWQQERIRGKMKTTRVILKEHVEQPLSNGEYGTEVVAQFRVLRLDKRSEGNRSTYVYSQEEWREMEVPELNNALQKKKEWRIVRTIIPTRKGQPLNFLPFTFTTTEGIDPHICKSELLDLVELNLDHWRLSVDLRHGLHFTALPTPCAAGIPDGLDLKIGSESAWTSTDPQFKSWFLDFDGKGIEAIQQAIERDEHLMSLIGSRLLETQKRASETAEAMIIRQAGEDSVIMSAAKSVEKALEKALWHMAYWMGGDESTKTTLSLTSGLQDLQLTTQDLIVMFKALQAGLISEQAWLEALIRKKLIRGRSWEEERDLPRVQLPDSTVSPQMDRSTVTTGLGVSNDKGFQPTT